jgi:hypothetical protein
MVETEPSVKRQRRTAGQIVEVPLGEGRKAFARVLREPLLAFYDMSTGVRETPSLEEITVQKIAFTIPVMNHSVARGRWKVIGSLPLTTALTQNPSFWKQDPLTGALSIYCEDLPPPGYERAATPAECRGLECAAVWDPEHVEDRLRDHFAGRPNAWLEGLRIR